MKLYYVHFILYLFMFSGEFDGSNFQESPLASGLCGPPQNLIATNITETNLDLSWDHFENDAPDTCKIYSIEGNINNPASLLGIFPGTIDSYNVSNLQPGTDYWFDVCAVCEDKSACTRVGPISTPVSCPEITAPQVLSITENSFAVSWTAPTYLNHVTGYEVNYTRQGSSITESLNTSGTTASTSTDLRSGTTYDVEICTLCDIPGQGSVKTCIPSFPVTTADCPAPINLTATSLGPNNVELDWENPGILTNHYGYQIRYKIVGTSGNFTSDDIPPIDDYNLTGLLENTSYYVRICTRCIPFGTACTDELIITTLQSCPTPPIPTTQSSTPDKIEINWQVDNSGNTDHYEINYKETGATGFQNIPSIPATSSSYILENLNPGTSYDIELCAVCVSGATYCSPLVLETTPELCLNPQNPQFGVVTENSIQVSWTAPTNGNVEDYTIKYRVENAASFQTATITSSENTYIIPNLLAGTNYEVEICTNCLPNQQSCFSVGFQQTHFPCLVPTSVGTGNISHNTIDVNWGAPSNGHVEHYRVYFRVAGTSNYPTGVVVPSGTTSYTISNLNPNSLYDILVCTYCADSDSEECVELLDVQTDFEPCLSPENPTVINFTHNEINLDWDAPANGNVSEYHLKYRPIGGSFQEEIISSGTTDYTLTNLQPNTTYEIEICTYCNDSQIETCTSFANTTTDFEPCLVPESGAITGVTSNSVNLSWSPPNNGNVDAYRLKYKIAGAPTFELIQVSSAITIYTIPNLSANTLYEIQICTYCADSDSEICLDLGTIQTDFKPCLAPNNAVISGVTPTSVFVNWDAPPNGNVNEYRIKYKEASQTNYQIITQNVNTTSYTFNALTPNTAYDIEVCTYCADSDSETCTSLVVTTGDYPPCLAPENLSTGFINENSIVFNWSAPSNGQADEYRVAFKPSSENDFSAFETVDIGTTIYTFTNLQANTNYDLQVCTYCTNTNTTTCAVYENVSTLEEACAAPINATFGTIEVNSITVNWEHPGNSNIELFVLRYKKTNETDFNIINLAPTVNEWSIPNLEADTDYEVEICSKCGILELCTSIGTAHTLEEPCEAPNNVTLEDISYNSVTLNWDSPTSGDLTRYIVKYRIDNGSSNYTEVTVGTNQTQYLLQGLSPDTDYEIQLCTECSSGQIVCQTSDTFTTDIEPCEVPTNVMVDSIQFSGIYLSWEAPPGGNLNQYQIQYKTTSETNFSVVNLPSSSLDYVITNIQSDEDYEVKVCSECTNGIINCVSLDTLITGLEPCIIASNAEIIDSTENSIIIGWCGHPNENIDSYTIKYKKTGEEEFNIVQNLDLANNGYILTGLNANTSYDIELCTECDSGETICTSLGQTSTTQTSDLYAGDLMIIGYDNDIGNEEDYVVITNLVPLPPQSEFLITNSVYEAGAAANVQSFQWRSGDVLANDSIASQRIVYRGHGILPPGSIICFVLPADGSGRELLAKDFRINGIPSDAFWVSNNGLTPNPKVNISITEPGVIFLAQGRWNPQTDAARFAGRIISGIQSGGEWYTEEEPTILGSMMSRIPPELTCIAIQGNVTPISFAAYYTGTPPDNRHHSVMNAIANFANWQNLVGDSSNNLPASICENIISVEQ